MTTVAARYRNGQLQFDGPPPADWPDGAAVRVALVSAADPDFSATTDDEQGDDPDAIARWLAWFDSLEPMILTPEDDAAIQAAQDELKRHEFATRAERDRKIDEAVR